MLHFTPWSAAARNVPLAGGFYGEFGDESCLFTSSLLDVASFSSLPPSIPPSLSLSLSQGARLPGSLCGHCSLVAFLWCSVSSAA
jgi:hypothetical protein